MWQVHSDVDKFKATEHIHYEVRKKMIRSPSLRMSSTDNGFVGSSS